MVTKLKKLISLILTLAVLIPGTIFLPTPRVAQASTDSKLAAGFNYSLRIDTNKTLWAWGDNSFGQLGNGTLTSSTTPVQVMLPDGSPLTNVKCVVTSYNHVLALTTSGTLYAWGDNSFGQLGNGTLTSSKNPVQIMSGVTDIAAGRAHSLAITNSGTATSSLWAWGDNSHGQLGIGATDSTLARSPIRVMVDVKSVAAGDYHSLATTGTEKKLWAWGDNGSGQLGDGTTTDRPTPTPVKVKNKVMSGVTSVTAGYRHSLALINGTLYAWGYNGSGQLGDGTTNSQRNPVKIMSKVINVATVYYHNLAITQDGTLWAWGDNSFGQVGDGTFINKLKPVKVLSNVESVAAGNSHSLAINKSGTIFAWGDNSSGQLNNAATTIKPPLPTPISALTLNRVKSVTGGYGHSLAINEDGTLWAWGDNSLGQLGVGTTKNNTNPATVKGMSQVMSVSAGLNFTLAIKEDGTLWAWGDNSLGQLGIGTTKNKSTPVKVMSGVNSVVAGDYHSLALKDDGTLWAWGDNGKRQLGDGTTINRLKPVKVLSEVKSMATSSDHTLAIKKDGTLWAWGDNSYYQLGDGTTTARSLPVPVLAMKEVMNVAAGRGYSLAITTDGSLWAWGHNNSYQLGYPTTTTDNCSPNPEMVMSRVMSIASGDGHSLAIKDDGTLWAWGYNSFGQVGDGTTTNRLIPKQVGSGVKYVAAGDYHSLAIMDNGTPYGTLWTWGLNSRGQFGNGTSTTRTTP